jgi:GTP-binding protein
MRITSAELLAVAVKKQQYPPEGPPEIACVGRSNVGKSSLLNLITGRKALARVSGSPGKTRTVNFYEMNGGAFRIVDLPGYGYAKVSKSESAGWRSMVDGYLTGRAALVKVALLCDIRRTPSEQDIQMYEWMKYNGMDGLVVVTKSDKAPKSALARSVEAIRTGLGAGPEAALIPVSALKKTGVGALLAEVGKAVEGAAEA